MTRLVPATLRESQQASPRVTNAIPAILPTKIPPSSPIEVFNKKEIATDGAMHSATPVSNSPTAMTINKAFIVLRSLRD